MSKALIIGILLLGIWLALWWTMSQNVSTRTIGIILTVLWWLFIIFTLIVRQEQTREEDISPEALQERLDWLIWMIQHLEEKKKTALVEKQMIYDHHLTEMYQTKKELENKLALQQANKNNILD